jgi:hypothetical protein
VARHRVVPEGSLSACTIADARSRRG